MYLFFVELFINYRMIKTSVDIAIIRQYQLQYKKMNIRKILQ